MRVIISAGGTGGHIYPALAIVNKIKENEPNSTFLYIGTHDRMEKDIIPKNNIPFVPIKIYGFDRQHFFKNIKTIYYFISACFKVRGLIKDFKPDVVIGVGGYVTVPVIYEAHRLGIKTLIHEQNSIPGLSNQFLSKYADKICVSLKTGLFPKDKEVFTGNPCATDAIKALEYKKSTFGLTKGKKLVLIVMGSLGSASINQTMIETLPLFKHKNYEVLYVSGKSYYESFKTIYFPQNVKIVPYIDGLAGIMKVSDVFVSRAGATTLSEIIALKTPSILIPSPYVPNDHQTKNALNLVNKNAAVMIKEDALTPEVLVKEIDHLINSPLLIKELKDNLDDMYIPNSASKIYKEIKELIK